MVSGGPKRKEDCKFERCLWAQEMAAKEIKTNKMRLYIGHDMKEEFLGRRSHSYIYHYKKPQETVKSALAVSPGHAEREQHTTSYKVINWWITVRESESKHWKECEYAGVNVGRREWEQESGRPIYLLQSDGSSVVSRVGGLGLTAVDRSGKVDWACTKMKASLPGRHTLAT